MESNSRVVHAFVNPDKLRSLKYGKKAAASKKLWENLKARREIFEELYKIQRNERDRNYVRWKIDQVTDLMDKVSKHF